MEHRYAYPSTDLSLYPVVIGEMPPMTNKEEKSWRIYHHCRVSSGGGQGEYGRRLQLAGGYFMLIDSTGVKKCITIYTQRIDRLHA